MQKGFSIPKVHGRGAGLGNEMLVWGKAFIAGQTLGLKTLPPAFGLNQRGYWRYFGTSRLDWVAHEALRRTFPHFTFGHADFLAAGTRDLTEALVAFAKQERFGDLPAYVLSLEGMWGGFDSIMPAREFLRAKLLGARGTLANLFKIERQLKRDALTIGFHIRRGDFAPPTDPESYRGKFNVALPLDWYVNIARNLIEALGPEVNIVVISDAPREELSPFGTEIPCLLTDDLPARDISDLLTLAACDLIVCSISSYSLWAAFLSSGHYIWPEANLTVQDGYASIWGQEADQTGPEGPTRIAREYNVTYDIPHLSKGTIAGWSGKINESLIERLRSRQEIKRRERDLLRYGVLRHGQ